MTAPGPVRVVIFTGGAELQPDVLDFVRRIDRHGDIDLVGVFCQARERGFAGIVSDLWARRGFLAVPLLLQRWMGMAVSVLSDPARATARRWTALNITDRLHFVPDLHDPHTLARLRDLAPDLGLVYGGPIIREELFGLPRLGTLGIHHGLAPEYRGKKTTFWAIYHGERYVGVTIQRIGSRLDGGDVVAQGRIPVGRAPLPVISARLVRLGLDLYMQAILAVRDGTAKFVPQAQGTGILCHDPAITDVLRFWWRYLARLAKPATHD